MKSAVAVTLILALSLHVASAAWWWPFGGEPELHAWCKCPYSKTSVCDPYFPSQSAETQALNGCIPSECKVMPESLSDIDAQLHRRLIGHNLTVNRLVEVLQAHENAPENNTRPLVLHFVGADQQAKLKAAKLIAEFRFRFHNASTNAWHAAAWFSHELGKKPAAELQTQLLQQYAECANSVFVIESFSTRARQDERLVPLLDAFISGRLQLSDAAYDDKQLEFLRPSPQAIIILISDNSSQGRPASLAKLHDGKSEALNAVPELVFDFPDRHAIKPIIESLLMELRCEKRLCFEWEPVVLEHLADEFRHKCAEAGSCDIDRLDMVNMMNWWGTRQSYFRMYFPGVLYRLASSGSAVKTERVEL